jgi:hypothetical protein
MCPQLSGELALGSLKAAGEVSIVMAKYSTKRLNTLLSLSVKGILIKKQMPMLELSTHSPDLSSCDIFNFLKLNTSLNGINFEPLLRHRQQRDNSYEETSDKVTLIAFSRHSRGTEMAV